MVITMNPFVIIFSPAHYNHNLLFYGCSVQLWTQFGQGRRGGIPGDPQCSQTSRSLKRSFGASDGLPCNAPRSLLQLWTNRSLVLWLQGSAGAQGLLYMRNDRACFPRLVLCSVSSHHPLLLLSIVRNRCPLARIAIVWGCTRSSARVTTSSRRMSLGLQMKRQMTVNKDMYFDGSYTKCKYIIDMRWGITYLANSRRLPTFVFDPSKMSFLIVSCL